MAKKKRRDEWEMCNENPRKMTGQTLRNPEKVQELLENREMRVSLDLTRQQRAQKSDKALRENEEMEKERVNIGKNSEETTNELDNENMRKAKKLVENPPDSILGIDEEKKD